MTAKLTNPTTTMPAPSSKRLRRAAARVRSIPTHDQSTAAPPATTTQEIQLLCKVPILAHCNARGQTRNPGRLAAP